MVSPYFVAGVPARRNPCFAPERSPENVHRVNNADRNKEVEDTSVTSIIADFIEVFLLVLALILRFWLKTIVYMARGIRGLYFAERPVQISLFIVGVLVFISLLIQTITGTSCIQKLNNMQVKSMEYDVPRMCYPIN